ncbi:MAG: alpha-D-ribose 1-methylphosphonate 5-triphosphate diphosphatase [Aliishimia sp.]
MTTQTIFANARLVLKDEVVRGSVQVTDGVIDDIDTGISVPKGAMDLDGDYLAPGMVELHTDNLERHLAPRPKVTWPYRGAILAHDRELAGTGITTVFDAIRVGSIVSGLNKRIGKYARQMATEILDLRERDVLRISHHIHLRAEICSETLMDELVEFTAQDRIGIVSMMDHTPGQRQFSDLAKFETYVRGKYSYGEQEFQDHMASLYEMRNKFGADHEAGVVAAAKRLGATLASHDDTTSEQVATSHAHGVTMAEFPTTVEAANACHELGIATIMGAPNFIRGASHSGNVSAADLAALDRLDILSSDYVPSGLLMAAVQLGTLWGDLARGVSTVTQRPAAAVGLNDRGTLAIDQRADLIRFVVLDDTPVLQETWCAGRRVF